MQMAEPVLDCRACVLRYPYVLAANRSNHHQSNNARHAELISMGPKIRTIPTEKIVPPVGCSLITAYCLILHLVRLAVTHTTSYYLYSPINRRCQFAVFSNKKRQQYHRTCLVLKRRRKDRKCFTLSV
jgi:hypothetical protein